VTSTGYNILFVCVPVAVLGATWIIARYLTATRHARAELASGKDYRGLTEEYRRLSDMSITAQEHLDLRLTELGVRIEDLQQQMKQLQHILKEVE
jgi:hypothetical protein